MAHNLSDDELRQELRKFGENVGPITISTRSVLIKRLLKLWKNQPKLRSVGSGIESELSRRVGKNRSSIRRKSFKALNRNSSHEEIYFEDSDEFETHSPQHIPEARSQKTEIDTDVFHDNLYYEEEELDEEMDSGNPHIYDILPITRSPASASVATSTSNVLGVDLKKHSDGMNYENYPPGFSYWNEVKNQKRHSSLYQSKLKQGDNYLVLDNGDTRRKKKVAKKLQDSVFMELWTAFLSFEVYNYLFMIPALFSLILNQVLLSADYPDRQFYQAVQHFLVIALMVVAIFIGLPMQFWALKTLKNILHKAAKAEEIYCMEYIDLGNEKTAGDKSDDEDLYYD